MSLPFPVSQRLAPEMNKLDVWSVFSPLSGFVPKDSINLGQGFMNWKPFPEAARAAETALDDVASNHYSLPKGRIALRKALSKHYSPSFGRGRDLDPEREVAIFSGANVAILSVLTAFINPGDEVVIIEPFFDQYLANITFNGGVPKFVPMRPPAKASNGKPASASEWTLDPQELRAAITSKTKAIILNTPSNPLGKVFTESELIEVGKIAEENNLIIISDEVYDCLAFPPAQHIRMASLKSFWDRTITIGSAGKSFSATGWRVGWAFGPEHLVKPATAASTRIVFSSVSPLQEAVAGAFENQGTFFEDQNKAYIERREVLTQALDRLKIGYTQPDGAYFIFVDIEKLKIPDDFETLDIIKDRTRDWRAAWFIAQTCGVVVIPPTDFYSKENANIGANYIRLAFCKDLETLRQGGERLQKLAPYLE